MEDNITLMEPLHDGSPAWLPYYEIMKFDSGNGL